MRNLYCFFFMLISELSICQTLTFGYGPIYTLTNQKVRMTNSKEDFQNTDFQMSLTYEQTIKKTKYSILGAFSQFNGHTWIKFREGSVIGSDGFPTLGVGYSGVKISKFELGLNYSIFSKKIIYLKPFVTIGLQISTPDNSEYGAFERQNGPEYFELEPITAEKFKTSQIVPSIGLETGVLFWKRLQLGLTIQGVYGHKSYQNMYFKYTYKGVPQETAIFEANGTGIYTALSIGYRLVK